MRLIDKVVLVTASTRGIGYAIVQACAKEGAKVYMAARNMEVAKAKCAKLQKDGYQVYPVYQDAVKTRDMLLWWSMLSSRRVTLMYL